MRTSDGAAEGGFAVAHARERDALLDVLVRHLGRDPDVLAVWLEGSLGRGTADDLSDLDIGVVVQDGRMPAIAGDPGRAVRSLVETTLEIAAPANAPRGGAFVLTWIPWGRHRVPLQVDWYWYEASTAIRPADSRLLLDRTASPIPVAASPALADGEVGEAIADTIRAALSMTTITAKRSARGNSWIVASHLTAVDQLCTTLDGLGKRHQRPSYSELRAHGLVGDVPNTPESQGKLLRSQVARLRDLIAATGNGDRFAEPLRQATRYIDAVLGISGQDDGGLSSGDG